ncbi:MAG: hypothetical protein Q7J98_07620, partial [Kiritimatiellia bacterium]|nr:hypothetical protein [Kiritimatiellia bacterium]
RHGKGALYLHHVEPLLDKLVRRKIRPMLWHDMMREWDSAALRRLARKADLVVWIYGGHPYAGGKLCNKEIIERFAGHNIPLWGATAYKVESMDSDLPDIAGREANALGWTEIAVRHGFIGVMATAWSRGWTCACQKVPIDGALDSALNVGVILHDGKPPKGGIKACQKELCRIGEGRVFSEARKSLANLSAARDIGWMQVRHLRQLLMTVTRDTRRLPAFRMVKIMKEMRDNLKRAEAASNDLRKALAGLMEPVWVERYIAERIEPLREEFILLETRVRQISPVAYSALFRRLS